MRLVGAPREANAPEKSVTCDHDRDCDARLNGSSIFRVGSTRKIGANGIVTGMRHPRAENKVNAIASAYQHYIRTGNLSIHATMHVD